jgi:hypothetical protein
MQLLQQQPSVRAGIGAARDAPSLALAMGTREPPYEHCAR